MATANTTWPVPDDRIDVVDVAGDELLERRVARDRRRRHRTRATSSSRSSTFLMPIAAADERGFSTHGGGTRAAQSSTSSSLNTAVNSGTGIPSVRACTRIASLSRKRPRWCGPCRAPAGARAASPPSRRRSRRARLCDRCDGGGRSRRRDGGSRLRRWRRAALIGFRRSSRAATRRRPACRRSAAARCSPGAWHSRRNGVALEIGGDAEDGQHLYSSLDRSEPTCGANITAGIRIGLAGTWASSSTATGARR